MVLDLDQVVSHAPATRHIPASGCFGYTEAQLAGLRAGGREAEAMLFARTGFPRREADLPIRMPRTTAG